MGSSALFSEVICVPQRCSLRMFSARLDLFMKEGRCKHAVPPIDPLLLQLFPALGPLLAHALLTLGPVLWHFGTLVCPYALLIA